MSAREVLHRIGRAAPWLFLGPITGPLAFGLHRAVKRRESVLAGLYGLAIILFWASLLNISGETVAALAQ